MPVCVVCTGPGGSRRVPVPVPDSAQTPWPESPWIPPEPEQGGGVLPQHGGDPPGGTGSARSPGLPGHRVTGATASPSATVPLCPADGRGCAGAAAAAAGSAGRAGRDVSALRGVSTGTGRAGAHGAPPAGNRIPHPDYFASCWAGAVGVADELQLAARLCAGHLNPILASSSR